MLNFLHGLVQRVRRGGGKMEPPVIVFLDDIYDDVKIEGESGTGRPAWSTIVTGDPGAGQTLEQDPVTILIATRLLGQTPRYNRRFKIPLLVTSEKE
jgi:hypothetical protein